MLPSRNKSPYCNIFSHVPTAVDTVHQLSTEERIELLCILCCNVKERIYPAGSDESLYNAQVGRLVSKLGRLSSEEQLKALKTLLIGSDTPLGRSYGLLSSSGKLAFWCRLSELIRQQRIISSIKLNALSTWTTAAIEKIESLALNQQIAVLHLVLGRMGIHPYER
jgi:hypothetical protein